MATKRQQTLTIVRTGKCVIKNNNRFLSLKQLLIFNMINFHLFNRISHLSSQSFARGNTEPFSAPQRCQGHTEHCALRS